MIGARHIQLAAKIAIEQAAFEKGISKTEAYKIIGVHQTTFSLRGGYLSTEIISRLAKLGIDPMRVLEDAEFLSIDQSRHSKSVNMQAKSVNMQELEKLIPTNTYRAFVTGAP